MKPLIYNLEDAAIFLKLDLLSIFYQVELTRTRLITTFKPKTNIKSFKRLFGINSVQGELQHALRDVLRDTDSTMNIATVYILFYTKNEIEHSKILEKTLKRLEN